MEYISDFITGKEVPNTGAEQTRQFMEKYLVEEKGFSEDNILVDEKFELEIYGEKYKTKADLLIKFDDKILCIIKTPAGSISSWSREVIAAARIFVPEYQIPFSIVCDGKNAEIYDSLTGTQLNVGIENIPSKKDLEVFLEKNSLVAFPGDKLERQKLVFRTYDTLNVNR